MLVVEVYLKPPLYNCSSHDDNISKSNSRAQEYKHFLSGEHLKYKKTVSLVL